MQESIASDPNVAAPSWLFSCPTCGSSLPLGPSPVHCPGCNRRFECQKGIWRFLSQQSLARYEPFLRRYEQVRADEGWGVPKPEYFRELPTVSEDDPQRSIWLRRQWSFRTLVSRVVAPHAAALDRAPRIVDAGAGNCWLTHRLGELGHSVAAVDISLHELDGLGAGGWYEPAFRDHAVLIQAEFDRLPLAANQADLVIFNASLHYSADIGESLREALRVLRPDGTIVIIDSPTYGDSRAGEHMIEEREAAFEARYGRQAAPLAMEGFLTKRRLAAIGDSVELRWTFFSDGSAARRMAAGLRTRLSTRRERAAMPLIIGNRI